VVLLKKYILKKNLFIFNTSPEIFFVEDSYLIIGNENNLKRLNINDFDNIFTIYYVPIWIMHLLNTRNVNIVILNQEGQVEKAILYKKFKPLINNPPTEYGFDLLTEKAQVIDRIFKTNEANSLLNFSLRKGIDIHTINKNLNFIPKAVIMDTLKLNYKITNKRAKEITNIIFNLTENIVVYSFYNKFIELGLNPENGFLNKENPSLIRDLTEIQRLKFLKKVHYLFQSRFFEKFDLNRKHFPDTTIKFIKILSNYFFYANRFKRIREIIYTAETFKRGNFNEVYCSL
jgi:hypothetical protein